MLHVNPGNPRDEFMLLSPLDPASELSFYQSKSGGKEKFYFCPKCGVRCFTIGGEGERVVVEMPEVSGGEKRGGKRKVWRVKWDGEKETVPYVSVNGATIENGEDLDWRVMTEEKRIQYFDGKSESADEKDARWDRPHDGGCY